MTKSSLHHSKAILDLGYIQILLLNKTQMIKGGGLPVTIYHSF